MITYYIYRVIYTSLCLSDVPLKYRDEVAEGLRKRGKDSCGN